MRRLARTSTPRHQRDHHAPRSRFRVGDGSIIGRAELIRGLLAPRADQLPAAMESGALVRISLFRARGVGHSPIASSRRYADADPDGRLTMHR